LYRKQMGIVTLLPKVVLQSIFVRLAMHVANIWFRLTIKDAIK